MLPYPVQCLTRFHPEFPRLDPPIHALWAQGTPSALGLLDRLPDRGFAIVGTRRPQGRSLEQVRAVVDRLRGRDFVILSGLAKGIDSAAHEAAMRAGLPTVAVLASPLDAIYPRENIDLARAILETDGLLLTEASPGAPLAKHLFLKRNRIIAGWAKATWVAEAGIRSGALTTSSQALELGKDCYTTPCFPGDEALAGNQRLLSRTESKCLWNVHDLAQTWPELNSIRLDEQSRGYRPRRDRDRWESSNPDLIKGDDASRLTHEVALRTQSSGGATAERLLDWAIGQKWEPLRFFGALQEALASGRVQDLNGVLNAPQT
jgi:DNA protecting protein DprA